MKEKQRERLQQLLGLTPAEQKRLEIHQRLLERVEAAELPEPTKTGHLWLVRLPLP